MIQDANFENFLFCPNSTFNIRKSHNISSGKALYFRSYQPKTSRGGGGKHPPVPLGLKGEASKQISQVRGSITKFLDKETGTLDEKIRTLFKEQGITIVSLLTVVGMAIGVLIESLLGGPTMSTSKSGNSSGGDGKVDGAREWVQKQLKAVLRLSCKLAGKALAALPGIIGLIISWILNIAKEVVGWLSQNLWALITVVGVLIYTYFMMKTRRK